MPKCLLCSYEGDNLTRHIKKEHDLTVAYYRARFPDAIIINPELQEKLKQNAAKAREARLKSKKIEQIPIKIEENREENRAYNKGDFSDYTAFKQEYTKKYGFMESPELEELLFLLVTNKKLETEYNMFQPAELVTSDAVQMLKDIRENTRKIQDLLITIAGLKKEREKTKDVVDLHKETMKRASKYIKENLGEFALRCPSCGQMIDTLGFPHPFFEGKHKYSVFSRELWFLILMKRIPIEYAAYVLHTSIESILDTAKERGDKVPEVDILKAESNLRELVNGQPVN